MIERVAKTVIAAAHALHDALPQTRPQALMLLA